MIAIIHLFFILLKIKYCVSTATTLEFLKISLEIPSDDKMKPEVKKILKNYESQIVEIGKDFEVCHGSDSVYTKCLEVFNQIGVKFGNFLKIFSIF